MSPELFQRWEHIVDDVEKSKIPIQFIKKITIRLKQRRRKTINVQSLFKQGLDVEELEEVVSKRLEEYDQDMLGIDFTLDIESIAEFVQPETDHILRKL